MIRNLSLVEGPETCMGSSRCEHRAVSKDGRVVCRKIVQGEDAVSLDVCHTCPFRAVNCSHLRFSLVHTSPSPLLVRFNGRTELWNDDPPEVRFRQAACGVRIVPIEHPDFCNRCSLRQPIHTHAKEPKDWRPAASPRKREVPEIRHAHPA